MLDFFKSNIIPAPFSIDKSLEWDIFFFPNLNCHNLGSLTIKIIFTLGYFLINE